MRARILNVEPDPVDVDHALLMSAQAIAAASEASQR